LHRPQSIQHNTKQYLQPTLPYQSTYSKRTSRGLGLKRLSPFPHPFLQFQSTYYTRVTPHSQVTPKSHQIHTSRWKPITNLPYILYLTHMPPSSSCPSNSPRPSYIPHQHPAPPRSHLPLRFSPSRSSRLLGRAPFPIPSYLANNLHISICHSTDPKLERVQYSTVYQYHTRPFVRAV
jgi:hypothetical protein